MRFGPIVSKLVPNCPGWGPPGNENVPDADIAAMAANGRQVIVVGAWQPHDPAGCSGADSAIQGSSVADGPAGVLMNGSGPDAAGPSAWLLEP